MRRPLGSFLSASSLVLGVGAYLLRPRVRLQIVFGRGQGSLGPVLLQGANYFGPESQPPCFGGANTTSIFGVERIYLVQSANIFGPGRTYLLQGK